MSYSKLLETLAEPQVLLTAYQLYIACALLSVIFLLIAGLSVWVATTRWRTHSEKPVRTGMTARGDLALMSETSKLATATQDYHTFDPAKNSAGSQDRMREDAVHVPPWDGAVIFDIEGLAFLGVPGLRAGRGGLAYWLH
ncbi:hypothetical protein BKA62DRAFT_768918 [Auriculariales sp. MPI-PUGE-AT-0066]|nr:hypothetical protein BKA62DRAFT_768918 [Auriculariales sp. MPI-PUGE-AT-0066]